MDAEDIGEVVNNETGRITVEDENGIRVPFISISLKDRKYVLTPIEGKYFDDAKVIADTLNGKDVMGPLAGITDPHPTQTPHGMRIVHKDYQGYVRPGDGGYPDGVVREIMLPWGQFRRFLSAEYERR